MLTISDRKMLLPKFFASAASIVFRKMALRCDHQKAKIHRYKNYSNKSDHFPREIIIIARRIQQILTCYNIYLAQTSTSKLVKLSLWPCLLFSVRGRSRRSRCRITRSIAVSHRCVVRPPHMHRARYQRH